MATATFYADSDGGEIGGNDFSSSYATARSTSATTAETNPLGKVGQLEQFGGINYQVYRDYMRFDLSALPGGAVVTGATLNVMLYSDISDTDFIVRCYRFAWSSPLAASAEANYDGAYGGSATLEGTLFDTASAPATETYHGMSIDHTALNVSGFNYYVLVSKEDVDNSAPSGNEYVTFYTANETGTAKDPYIEVTYTLPGVPNGLMMMGAGA